MLLHALQDAVGVVDVGVGLDEVVCAGNLLVAPHQLVALGPDDLRQHPVGVQYFQDAHQLFAFDEGGGDVVDLPLLAVLLRLQLPQPLPLRHVRLNC